MSADHEYLKNKHILVIKPILMLRIQSSVEAMQRAVELINQYNCHNVLCDFRYIDINFTITTAIQRPKMWHQLGLPKGIKIAGLFNEINDDIIMRTNTMFSSGFHVTTYTDYDKAISWLSKK